jgi:hypothetical protein
MYNWESRLKVVSAAPGNFLRDEGMVANEGRGGRGRKLGPRSALCAD